MNHNTSWGPRPWGSPSQSCSIPFGIPWFVASLNFQVPWCSPCPYAISQGRIHLRYAWSSHSLTWSLCVCWHLELPYPLSSRRAWLCAVAEPRVLTHTPLDAPAQLACDGREIWAGGASRAQPSRPSMWSQPSGLRAKLEQRPCW